MESWRIVWRAAEGLFSTEGLRALKAALVKDDERLCQGRTTLPPALVATADFPVEQACLACFCAWQGDGLNTVGEVEQFFGRFCHDVDLALGEPAGCRHLLNWFDETPRKEMREQLLPEVDRALARRDA